MKRIVSIFLLIICIPCVYIFALKVNNLTVNTLKNPSGIDETPVFAWTLESSKRDVRQESYKVSLYSDNKCSNLIWNSGVVESSSSCMVKVKGLPYSPASRYYWKVEVRDNYGNTAVSNECAYYDTGLNGDWEGAEWIRMGDNCNYENFEICTDVTIMNGNPSLIFGWTADRAYFMWQIITTEGDIPKLRRNIRTFQDYYWTEDIVLNDYAVRDLINKEHNWHIVCKGHDIATYIDGVLVDQLRNPIRRVPIGNIGFLCGPPMGIDYDKAYFDNLKVVYNYPDKSIETLSEDFESGISKYFLDIGIVDVLGNRKCFVESNGTETKSLEVENQNVCFYKDFTISKPIKKASLFVASLGSYDLWLNGNRVGHVMGDGSVQYEEMKPSWTDFNKRTFYSSYDVTNLCANGENKVGAVVSPGYLLGQIARNHYSSFQLSLIAKLVITYEDGSQEIVGTDETWKTSKSGPLLRSDIYHGEYYDATRPYPWEQAAQAVERNPVEFQYPYILEPIKGPYSTMLSNNVLKPKTITIYEGVLPGSDYGKINIVSTIESNTSINLKKGQTAIYDFGQNFAGLPRIFVRGAVGTRLHLLTAEMLNDSGSKSRGNDGAEGSLYRANLNCRSELYYVLNGNGAGETYQGISTYYGFRYCSITASEDIEIKSITGIPISSATEDIGCISTDNSLVNRLYEASLWGQRSNMLNIPTDCCNRRERLGWAGDTQVFSYTGMYNSNMSAFYRKWLQDMRDSQREDGAYCDISPMQFSYFGDAGWADAGIIVTWNVYQMTGDIDVVKENFDAMNRYMEWLSKQTVPGCKYPGGSVAQGDWLAIVPTEERFIAHLYYAYVTKLMHKMSLLLTSLGDGYGDLSNHYAELYSAICNEIQEKYFDSNGLKEPTQTKCAMLLHFGVCKDEVQRKSVSETLKQLIIENGYKLNTGFIGTSILNLALSESGLDDLAYDLLLQRDYPSWQYSLDQGGTTFWERWNSYTNEAGFGDASMNSFNHYAYGAICEWLYRCMAGIAPSEDAPGFKKIVFKPCPDTRSYIPYGQERVQSAKATYQSPYGLISAEWKIDGDGNFTYHIIVPPNSEGYVYFPNVQEDTQIYECEDLADDAEGVEYICYEGGRKIYNVKSGEYIFSLTSQKSSVPDVIIENNISVYPNPVKDILYIKTDSEIHKAT